MYGILLTSTIPTTTTSPSASTTMKGHSGATKQARKIGVEVEVEVDGDEDGVDGDGMVRSLTPRDISYVLIAGLIPQDVRDMSTPVSLLYISCCTTYPYWCYR